MLYNTTCITVNTVTVHACAHHDSALLQQAAVCAQLVEEAVQPTILQPALMHSGGQDVSSMSHALTLIYSSSGAGCKLGSTEGWHMLGFAGGHIHWVKVGAQWVQGGALAGQRVLGYEQHMLGTTLARTGC